MVDLNFQKYPVYKSSGVEWLGNIPEHWKLKKLKFYFQPGKQGIKIGPFGSSIKSDIIKSSNEIKSMERYKVYGQENVIGNSFKKGDKYINVKNFNRLSAYQIYPGNLVITMMGTTGRCMVVPLEIEPGIMDSHLIRISVNENEIKPDFLALLINDSFYIYAQVKINSKGSIMEGLNSSIIKSLLIAQPPLPEQQAIANFLDHKLAQIDEYIAKKQRMIELLKEQKTVIINQAVTKGLNLDVPMKFSGIEWLGEIPEHWEVRKVKHLAKNDPGIVQTGPFGAQLHASDYVEEGVPLILIRNVKNLQIDDSNIPKISEEKAESLSIYRLEVGDIVFSRVGSIGRIALVTEREKGWMISGQMLRLRINHPILYNYFSVHIFSSSLVSNFVGFYSVGSTRDSINTEILRNFVMPIPPISEQKEIALFIEKKSEKINRAIATIEKEIKLIQEYRTTLISETVTGKIDVRKYRPPQ